MNNGPYKAIAGLGVGQGSEHVWLVGWSFFPENWGTGATKQAQQKLQLSMVVIFVRFDCGPDCYFQRIIYEIGCTLHGSKDGDIRRFNDMMITRPLAAAGAVRRKGG